MTSWIEKEKIKEGAGYNLLPHGQQKFKGSVHDLWRGGEIGDGIRSRLKEKKKSGRLGSGTQ